MISSELFFNNEKNGSEQKKLRMNWCKRQNERNWDDEIFLDEWKFYLKALRKMTLVIKN